MKKLSILAICVMVALASCKKENINQTNNNQNGVETSTVKFAFKPYNVSPMRGETTVSIGEYCNKLDIYIYDTLDMENPVVSIHQSLDENNDFGSLTTVLQTNKTYTIYAVAHKCTGPATITDGIVTFPDEKTTVSFFYKDTFSPADGLTKSCEMFRIVGAFRMETTDAAPSNIEKFRFTVNEIGKAWNVEGHSENKSEYTVNFTSFTTNPNGTVTFTLYLIADDLENTTNVDITVSTYDENNELVEERMFEDVPIKNGWKTTYTGTFFISFDMGFTFLGDDWNNFDPTGF